MLGRIAEESGSRAVALTFVGAPRAKCRKLALLPGTLGRARPELLPGTRGAAHGNYVILFRYEEDRLEVVNVIDGHRDIAARFADDPGS